MNHVRFDVIQKHTESKHSKTTEAVDKATEKAATAYLANRYKSFRESIFYKRYTALQKTLTGKGLTNIRKDYVQWANTGRTVPPYIVDFMECVLNVRQSLVHGTVEYNEVDRQLKRCKSNYGKLYCGTAGCTFEATCISVVDYVAFREDREYKDAVMYGCYSCSDAKSMFLGYCHNKLPGSPVAYCNKHVTQPCISFQSQGNRTCMCCKSKDSAGNSKGDGTKPMYEYYTCTDCNSLTASTANTERKGILEDFYREGLQLYAHIASALLPNANPIVVHGRKRQLLVNDHKMDVSITHTHASGYKIVDVFELNGSGHVITKDLKDSVLIAQKAPAGTCYRIWQVRTYTNDFSLMEVCRQHWLRHHVLTAACNGANIPRIQVFLAGGTPDNKAKLVAYFKNNTKFPTKFLNSNVNILTGVPAPVCRENGAKALFDCRDLVRNGKSIKEYAPFQVIWDWSTWDQQYGATRQGAYKPTSRTYMQMYVCTPLHLRKNMMIVPETLDLESMEHSPEFKEPDGEEEQGGKETRTRKSKRK